MQKSFRWWPPLTLRTQLDVKQVNPKPDRQMLLCHRGETLFNTLMSSPQHKSLSKGWVGRTNRTTIKAITNSKHLSTAAAFSLLFSRDQNASAQTRNGAIKRSGVTLSLSSSKCLGANEILSLSLSVSLYKDLTTGRRLNAKTIHRPQTLTLRWQPNEPAFASLSETINWKVFRSLS